MIALRVPACDAGGPMVTVMVSAVAAMVLGSAVVSASVRSAFRRTPVGVVKALRRTGVEHRVTVPRWPAPSGTWNPGKPLGRHNLIFEPGDGVYRLDDHDVVHLMWTPQGGAPREYCGTVPTSIEPGSAQRRQIQRIGRALIGSYAVALIVGFAFGFTLSAGRTAVRLGWGAGGIAIAMVAVWVVVLAVNVARGTRGVLTRRDGTDTAR